MSEDARANDQPRYVLGPKPIYDYALTMARLQYEIDRLTQMSDRHQRKELYDQVIERYNRAHGQNPKITLVDICRDMGVSYEAVKKYRQRAPKHKAKK